MRRAASRPPFFLFGVLDRSETVLVGFDVLFDELDHRGIDVFSGAALQAGDCHFNGSLEVLLV